MTRASDNEFPSVLLDEQASAPTTPASGFWRVYAKSDGLYIVDDAGAETGPFGGGGGGSTVPQWMEDLATRPTSAHADDDEFDDDSITGWTSVTPTGTATWTEKAGGLSVAASGMSANDIAVQLKSMTTTTPPITIDTVFKTLASDISFHMNGVLFSNGTSSGSSAVAVFFYNSASNTTVQVWSGTLTNMTSVSGTDLYLPPDDGHHALGLMYLRMVYSAANTWKVLLSPDGVTYTNFGKTAESASLSPTHYGVLASNWGSGVPLVSSFEYFRVTEADLS